MPVEWFKFRTPSAHLFVEACRQNGIDFVRDYNGYNQFGVTYQREMCGMGCPGQLWRSFPSTWSLEKHPTEEC